MTTTSARKVQELIVAIAMVKDAHKRVNKCSDFYSLMPSQRRRLDTEANKLFSSYVELTELAREADHMLHGTNLMTTGER